jgi:hypothetical protein
MEVTKIGNIEINALKSESDKIKSGMGSVAWAVLEMFKRGGMNKDEVHDLHTKMEHFFANPTNDECNAILKVVETRIQEDKEPGKDIWYV